MSKSQWFLTAQIAAGLLLILTAPAAFGQLDNIQVSNQTSASAVISWTTTDSTDGCVRYGLTTFLGDTACDPRADDDLHFVQMSGLTPDTTYYFEVASGGEVDSNGGSYYSFNTTKVGGWHAIHHLWHGSSVRQHYGCRSNNRLCGCQISWRRFVSSSGCAHQRQRCVVPQPG